MAQRYQDVTEEEQAQKNLVAHFILELNRLHEETDGKENLKNAENKGKKALFMCTFQSRPKGIFIALGWSISMPDMSQSNSLQDRFLTSDLSLGHRYRPWAVSLL